MAMSCGFGKAQMNVTPMIDVLLVLIIIFMLIVPVPPRGLNALVPQESPPGQPSSPSQDVVISIRADGTVLLNQDVVELANLEERLKQVFKTNTNRPIFIRGEGKLDFEKVAQVIDLAKGAGLERIGLMTR
jgi:biopolymer transport protein TolR